MLNHLTVYQWENAEKIENEEVNTNIEKKVEDTHIKETKEQL
jgi:hypothetical protein